MEKYAVIMAGGTGSRLWPLSRESKPKQFICVENDKCMLVQTIERICELVPAKNCFIITNQKLRALTEKTVEGLLPLSNILLEPARKNTAACIVYASLLLKKRLGDVLLTFVPADGYVKNNAAYQSALAQAFLAAETGGLVIIGITPTYPATGYGYIQILPGQEISKNAFAVHRFIEKPDFETAEKLVSSGEFLWNSGIVCANTAVLAENTRQLLPIHYAEISAALNQYDGQELSPIAAAYEKLPDISFDKGVLEKSALIHAVRGHFDWDDIGSLDAMSKTFAPDAAGNFIQGDFVGIDTGNSAIYSDGALISAIGVDDMVIAATKDAVLVCRRDRVQEIKKLVEKLKQNGREALT